jgi:hypothetical protein
MKTYCYQFKDELIYVIHKSDEIWIPIKSITTACKLSHTNTLHRLKQYKEDCPHHFMLVTAVSIDENYHKYKNSSIQLISLPGLLQYVSVIGKNINNLNLLLEFCNWVDLTLQTKLMDVYRSRNAVALLDRVKTTTGRVLQVCDIIDSADFNDVFVHSWRIDYRKEKDRYSIITLINKKKTYLSRFVTNCPDNMYVDHINHDLFDNRQSNLRICTNSQNCMNRKPYVKYKGVQYNKKKDYFYACVIKNGKRITKHCFSTEEDAARAYNEMAKEIHGEFAYLNFIEESK